MTLPANHPRLTKRPFTPGELLADGIVHAVALVAGLIAFAVLLAHVIGKGNLGTFAALAVYAAGYFAMFGFSAAYNLVPISPLKWVLRRFDHSAIYLMIAGTYTAVVVHFENVVFAAVLAGIVWTGAILGAVVKLVWPGRLDGLAVVAYIALGVVGLAAIGPAREALPGPSLVLLLLGGATYVAGVAFYRWHRLKFHNAIWHLCVAVAAGLHFAAVAIAVAA